MHGDRVADTENQQDQGGEDDLLTKLGDRPRFFDRLDHLDHGCQLCQKPGKRRQRCQQRQ